MRNGAVTESSYSKQLRSRFACSWPPSRFRRSLPAQTEKPTLIVGIVVDQFRYDYLARIGKDYKADLAKMLADGAVFTNAHYQQMPAVTAVGHSIFLSGASPAASGIVGNTWFERESNTVVTSVCDYTVRELGGETQKPGPRCDDGDPASPRRLEVSTVGDELRNFDERCKVIGISSKARGALLLSGDCAFGPVTTPTVVHLPK